ncbi:MAG: GDSL-type esterase/lipase family protein [Xanthomonadales bacterium]|jgi:lysophospholipase L1-like esterase|nr:GDSL-type esterase/lipase family protein [Xanthomonadales bacterium]
MTGEAPRHPLLKALVAGGGLLRDLWVGLGVALILLWAGDQLLRAVLPERGEARVLEGAGAPDRATADAFDSPAAAQAYWAEHETARHTRWQPWVYWRRLPHRGEWINVDEHGFRVTPRAGAGDTPRTLRVWMFGGSLVWGTGVRDADTIPALLAQALAARHPDHAIEVANFGESGYVSQQSLGAFQNALRCAGPLPDAVVFIDGVNDVYAAFQSGRAGLSQNEVNRVREFNSSRQLPKQLAAWGARLEGWQRLLAPAPPPAPDSTALAAEVVRVYRDSVAQARALAADRGIGALHVWQPHLYAKTSRSAYEAGQHDSSLARHRDLQLAADAALREAVDPQLLDASALFADTAKPRFIDFVHLGRAGNAALVAAILPVLEPLLADVAAAVPVSDDGQQPVCTDRPSTE